MIFKSYLLTQHGLVCGADAQLWFSYVAHYWDYLVQLLRPLSP